MADLDLKNIKATVVVDARGTYCPGPLMELIKEMRQQPVGSIIEVISGDAGSAKDVPEWLKKVNQEFLGVLEENNYWRIFAKKVKDM
ncbi:MAG: sulfurtransferase TusA family protein [Candidatus Acididesulfobacter diazotrophicus]|jgi:TusA-related sulfurtransferase|uniref:Sulfurtransferase TusA family protein n=1 Tax=Candidatus Acididesulfobacter diazotrophicus TaxID=2597226 RepID=A0A519BMI7_9DELT|nr:MAG: sulfurtransferase TusA family protein [Candidatus Acididesulfobacter diazotrophicus]